MANCMNMCMLSEGHLASNQDLPVTYGESNVVAAVVLPSLPHLW